MSISYSSFNNRFVEKIRELFYLYNSSKKDIKKKIEYIEKEAKKIERLFLTKTNKILQNCKILDVGCGQNASLLKYFAVNNDVVGIDSDYIPSKFSIKQYYLMFKQNDLYRIFKTIVRKFLGVDRKRDRVFNKFFNVKTKPQIKILCIDANSMNFNNNQFDLVISISVFEHIPEPRKALKEIKRVLKPGGCAYISIHLFTSESGGHDPKIISGKRDNIPYWSHLRPQYSHLIKANSYLNKLRIKEWDKLLGEILPGYERELDQGEEKDSYLKNELMSIRKKNELNDYSDGELLTYNYVVVWNK